MLRQDTIICGTSTTGAGALTLAACPNPPGGVDPYAWLTATGFGFANGNAVIVSYVIIEYSDTTFSQAVNFEKGVGTLTLGANLAASSLARTTVQSVAGTLNTAGSPTYQSPSPISIGVAANVLVFVGPSAADVPAYSPYYDNTLGDGYGVGPDGVHAISQGPLLTSLNDYYSLFRWTVPMLVKRCTMNVDTGTGSGTSSAYARIYQINSSGRPGKLLVDFGAFAGTNPLNAAGVIRTTALTNGFLLLPGEYFFDFLPNFSAGSSRMTVRQNGAVIDSFRLGTFSFTGTIIGTIATGGTAGAAPDPANLTGYARDPSGGAAGNLFLLNVS